LCSKLLQKHPENRLSAVEALNHQWFQINGEKKVVIPIIASRKEIKMEFEEKDKVIVEN
jgi:serine/threonine protein kinase